MRTYGGSSAISLLDDSFFMFLPPPLIFSSKAFYPPFSLSCICPIPFQHNPFEPGQCYIHFLNSPLFQSFTFLFSLSDIVCRTKNLHSRFFFKKLFHSPFIFSFISVSPCSFIGF